MTDHYYTKLQIYNYFKSFVFSCNFYNIIDIVNFLLKQKIMNEIGAISLKYFKPSTFQQQEKIIQTVNILQ